MKKQTMYKDGGRGEEEYLVETQEERGIKSDIWKKRERDERRRHLDRQKTNN